MVSMISTSGRRRVFPRSEPDKEIAHYAALTPEEVEAELRRYRMDPAPTIQNVQELVSMTLEKCGGPRGLLHQKRPLTSSHSAEACLPRRRRIETWRWISIAA